MFLPSVLWWRGRLLILLPLVIVPLPLLFVLLPIFFYLCPLQNLHFD
jgi:hypothetical protein